MINRSQGLVLAFFVSVVIALLAISGVDASIYKSQLHAASVPLAVALLVVFVGLLCVGVVRRWRWIFWLITVAFLAGFLRVPASLLELLDRVPASGPVWYVLLQGIIGVVQLVIGLLLLRGYRRGGPWAAF
jgi:hypothetical protein